MRDTIKQTLDMIFAEQRDVGETVQPPASPESIDALVRYAHERHQVKLSPTYIELLKTADGLDFNGSVIYTTQQKKLPKGGTLLGFREMNDMFEQLDGPHYVIYGESGDDLAAQERGGGWHIIDKASPSVRESFATADGLFERMLQRAYAQ